MTEFDDERIAELEAVLWHDDPRFARGLGRGRPRRPREYRNGRAWLAMGSALSAVFTGAMVPHGLLLGVGLMVAAFAVNLFDTSRRRRLRRRRP
ncbi:DUF3040 domain-containing protein [Streptomyces sp. TBY4]|uniref:DUF3040 domain-containing protein n=1 Tax=Streptomyces sp. TBY4 TaxID=2962030 RepID=UPI0020B7DB8F|nr:DUF3040 domain-containing protein [Streptomyces sp. TBY4]MCP3754210.1 DUF3040 domain-containing protein [Streptomyces sp. TBY4]